ncbi:cysteine proteinase [Dentipellis sp. KUC8613]|nr:cysteine proteinase [Dentipellis sp. KUC8613]
MPHKRPAADTLLPTRAPKVPRTTHKGFLGAGASASQNEGFVARWQKVLGDLTSLSAETAAAVMRYISGSQSDSPASPPSSPSPPPSPPIPIELTVPSPAISRHLPPRPPLPKSYFRSGAPPPSPHQPPVATPARREPPRYTSSANRTMPPPSQTPSASAASSSVFTSEPSTSTLTQRTSHPDLDNAIKIVQKRTKSMTPKKHHHRDHIYAHVHKSRVREEREKDKVRLAQELYDLKRADGYGSDFTSFKSVLGWLNYRVQLEKLDGSKLLSPSSSMPNLRSHAAAQESMRRIPLSEDVTSDFLARALEKARITLSSPKPLKPFSPSLEQIQKLKRARDEEIEQLLRPKYPLSLPPEKDAEVTDLFAKRGTIARIAREQVSDRDISRLRPSQWLNDEIINFYGQMILSRSEGSKENPGAGAPGVNGVNGVNSTKKGSSKGKLLDVHYFSTFFWSKLKGDGYEKGRLAKWTKRIDIFSKDVILIPINHNNSHWTGAAINFRQKRVESYDSMGMNRREVHKLLREYIDAEHRNKKKKPFDFTGWQDYSPENTPQQENGYDCGVFTCQFLESLARGEDAPFGFEQKHMPYLRRRMVWEIGHTQFLGQS